MELAGLLIVLGSLWFGVELGTGVPRSRAVQVLRVCWPFLVLLVLWQLARFASNTNDQGGDMTDQLAIRLFAIVYVVLYGVVALGGRIYRLAVGRPLAAGATETMVASGLRNRLAARPVLTVATRDTRRGSRFWQVVGLGLVALAVVVVVLGVLQLL